MPAGPPETHLHHRSIRRRCRRRQHRATARLEPMGKSCPSPASLCGEQVPRGAVAGASLGFCSLVVESTFLAASSTTSARRLTPARPQDRQLALREAQSRDLFAHPKDQLQAPLCRELRLVPQTLLELQQRTATLRACSRSFSRDRRAMPTTSQGGWTPCKPRSTAARLRSTRCTQVLPHQVLLPWPLQAANPGGSGASSPAADRLQRQEVSSQQPLRAPPMHQARPRLSRLRRGPAST